MNLAAMLRRQQSADVRYALTGAAGQYARTLLAQTRTTPQVRPTLLCDLNVEAVQQTCADLGLGHV